MKILFIALLLIYVSCDSDVISKRDVAKTDSLAILLNNSSMDRYLNFLFGNTQNFDSLKLSLNELDRAIEMDSTNTVFYSNKANILTLLDRHEEAIDVLKQALSIKPDFAETISSIGSLYDAIGQNEQAQIWYKKAINAYDKRIEEDRFVVNSKLNKAFLLFFTQDEDSAKSAFYKLKKEYPDNAEVQFMEQMFIDFKKEDFLKDL